MKIGINLHDAPFLLHVFLFICTSSVETSKEKRKQNNVGAMLWGVGQIWMGLEFWKPKLYFIRITFDLEIHFQSTRVAWFLKQLRFPPLSSTIFLRFLWTSNISVTLFICQGLHEIVADKWNVLWLVSLVSMYLEFLLESLLGWMRKFWGSSTSVCRV